MQPDYGIGEFCYFSQSERLLVSIPNCRQIMDRSAGFVSFINCERIVAGDRALIFTLLLVKLFEFRWVLDWFARLRSRFGLWGSEVFTFRKFDSYDLDCGSTWLSRLSLQSLRPSLKEKPSFWRKPTNWHQLESFSRTVRRLHGLEDFQVRVQDWGASLRTKKTMGGKVPKLVSHEP